MPNKKKQKFNDSLLCSGLNHAAEQIHQKAKDKGFWDKKRETGTLLMLCVSELAEAMEADRKNKIANLQKYNEQINDSSSEDSLLNFEKAFIMNVKDTFEDELADTIIRILDLCGARKIDIEKHINLKLKYNSTRNQMHGKKY